MHLDGARLPRWVTGFSSRHGRTTAEVTEGGLRLTAADGEVADVQLPFLPWPGRLASTGTCTLDAAVQAAAAHLRSPRRVAVLLVRRGGYACALVDGGTLSASKVGSRHVQSRTAAGGWSQQRFARRRANQADQLVGAAVDAAARLLLPSAGRSAGAGGTRSPGGGPTAWLATGGDRPLVEQALADPRLRTLALLPRGPHLAIGDPKRDLVDSLPALLRHVWISLSDTGHPAGEPPPAEPSPSALFRPTRGDA